MNKLTFFYIFILCCNFVLADDPADYIDDPPGFHGMILFGEGPEYYLSHLPMWMEPHNYQVVLKVSVSANIHEAIKKQKQNGVTLFSMAPDTRFGLPSLANGDVASFEGTAYANHFERDGTELTSGTFTFSELVLFKKLDPHEPSPAPNAQEYIQFGNSQHQYLVHVAHGAPEIDEILEVNPTPLNVSVRNLVCHTDDVEKNMSGLDETAPQNCTQVEQDAIVNEQAVCSDPDQLSRSAASDLLSTLSNQIIINKDIYTDTRDLGSMPHGAHH